MWRWEWGQIHQDRQTDRQVSKTLWIEITPMLDVCFGSDVEIKALNCRVCVYFSLFCPILIALLELILEVTEEDCFIFLNSAVIMETTYFYDDLTIKKIPLE